MEYNDSFLNAKEVSKYLRIPLRTVHRLTKDGKIKAVRIGKQWRYKRTDIENYFSFGTNFSREPARKLNDFIERRACPRINTDFDCQYLINLPRFKIINDKGIIKNLSTGGSLVIAQCKDIEIDDPILLQFILVSDSDKKLEINVNGRIIRKTPSGFGVKFKNTSKQTVDSITEYIG